MSEPDAGPSSHNRNPTGTNQHADCPTADDENVAKLLRQYHSDNITDKKIISSLLAKKGYPMSEATVTRRKRKLGLKGSGASTKALPEAVKRQMVLKQLAKDPTGKQGPRTIKEAIARDEGVHITRDWISDEMHALEPDAFAGREPTAKKVPRVALVALGKHHHWSGDGHDKLVKIGFPVWGIRDMWSGKWLGLWTVPDNRLKVTIAYLYLSLVAELGGIPIQSTTDCGSETTEMYGFANALREAFAPDLPITILTAHMFLPSIHNTTIERGWLRLRLQWGDNVIVFWEAGLDLYDPLDPVQEELVRWLWSTVIQKELDELKDRFNSHVIRLDRSKSNPSGVAPNVAYELFEKYGGEDCLQPVDSDVVHTLMEELGGEELVLFVSREYAAKAQSICDTLGLRDLNMQNAWHVFSTMLPLMQAV